MSAPPGALLRSRAVQRAGALAGAGCLAALALAMMGDANALRARWPQEADLLYMPSAEVLRVLSLGHSEMAADLVAARANVYFGTQIGAHGEQRWLERYLETVADLDPRFHRIYFLGASMLVYTGRRITVEAVQAANKLLDRGLQEFPGDWELYFQEGFNYLYEMPNAAGPRDQRVKAWKERGVGLLAVASQFDEAPIWLPNLVARVRADQGHLELAVRSLEQAYAATSNEQAREQIRLKLLQLRGQQAVQELEEGEKEIDELRRRCPPYFPEALCILAGPPPPGPVSAALPPAAP